MANRERLISSTEFFLRKPDNDETMRIIANQSHRSDRIIRAEWHDDNGDVVATATIVPSQHKNDSLMLEALTGADMVRIQEVSAFTKFIETIPELDLLGR